MLKFNISTACPKPKVSQFQSGCQCNWSHLQKTFRVKGIARREFIADSYLEVLRTKIRCNFVTSLCNFV